MRVLICVACILSLLLFFLNSPTFAAQPKPEPPLDGWADQHGNRLYWNTVKSPQALEMRGATWKDPALIPPLNVAPGSGRVATPIGPGQKKPAPRAKAPVRKPAPKVALPAQGTPPAAANNQGIPPLRAPNPHDEDRGYRPIKQFDPFAQGEPVYRDRLQ